MVKHLLEWQKHPNNSTSLGKNYQAVYQHGIDSVFSIIETPSELPYLLAHGERFLTQTVENIARLIKLNN